MESKSKYIFINIRTPFEIKSEGSYIPIVERMVVDIESCDKLPEINNSENDRVLLEQIYLAMNSQKRLIQKSDVVFEKNLEKETITESEIKIINQDIIRFVFNTNKTSNRKTRQNMTIRKQIPNTKSSHHYTRKKYDIDESVCSESDSDT